MQENVSHIDPTVSAFTPYELRRFRAPGKGPIGRLTEEEMQVALSAL